MSGSTAPRRSGSVSVGCSAYELAHPLPALQGAAQPRQLPAMAAASVMGYMHTTATGRAVAAQLQVIEAQRKAYEAGRHDRRPAWRVVSDCKGCGAPLTSHEAACSYCARPNPEHQWHNP